MNELMEALTGHQQLFHNGPVPEFEAQPEGWLKITKEGVDVKINVFHFLMNHLTFNQKLDDRFRNFAEGQDILLNELAAEAYVKVLHGKGLGGRGKPFFNSTGGSLLSEVIRYWYWTDKNGSHVLLQICNGDPAAFDVNDLGIFNDESALIYCAECDLSWVTANGKEWRAIDGKWAVESDYCPRCGEILRVGVC